MVLDYRYFEGSRFLLFQMAEITNTQKMLAKLLNITYNGVSNSNNN